MQPTEKFEKSIQSIDQSLGEIERTLEQVLALAQLSGSCPLPALRRGESINIKWILLGLV